MVYDYVLASVYYLNRTNRREVPAGLVRFWGNSDLHFCFAMFVWFIVVHFVSLILYHPVEEYNEISSRQV